MAELSTKHKDKKSKKLSIKDHWIEVCDILFHSQIHHSTHIGLADFLKPFILDMDGSHNGLGAVLSQDLHLPAEVQQFHEIGIFGTQVDC